MTTAVVTDSNSGISAKDAEQNGIYILPMPVIIDGRTYYENQTINRETFYSAMEADSDISTSQPTPGDVLEIWKQALASADEVVYIPMSSGLSGSCQSAAMLAKEFDGKVHVVDNRRISVSLYQSVMRAVSFARGGDSASEIRKKLEAEGPESTIYLTVETLKYFRKSGRITPAAAALGDLFNIKPVLCTKGGKFDVQSNVHGMLKAKKTMLKSIASDRKTILSRFSEEEISVGCADSFVKESDSLKWQQMVRDEFTDYDVFFQPLSLSITCHTGPNACGLGIFRKV